jgi:hypothetical protein
MAVHRQAEALHIDGGRNTTDAPPISD